MGNRIYRETVSINTDQVRDFFNNRAKMVADKGVSVVMLQEHDQDSAIKECNFEEEIVKQRLQITPKTRVLELGCGIGRLAESILPMCGFYCGIDFSEEMITTAKSICSKYGSHAQFHTMSCTEATEKNSDFFGGKFDCLVVSGIFMYINDEELTQIFNRLPNLLSKCSTIYFLDPVGVGERLTLCEFYSKELQTTYNAIYRTPEEYNQAYQPLFQAGFSIIEQGPVPQAKKQYSDSDRWYTIFKREDK